MMFPIKQRYKNLSKSQLLAVMTVVRSMMFPIKQRYKNLSKSQRYTSKPVFLWKMFPIKQRYKNLSKSQLFYIFVIKKFDVSYKTKIQKFKQITTMFRYLYQKHLMFPIKQRYKNLSKSQRRTYGNTSLFDVSYKTKIQKFKQITTTTFLAVSLPRMFPIKQRYKNLSKSQLQAIIRTQIKMFPIKQRYKNLSKSQHLRAMALMIVRCFL